MAKCPHCLKEFKNTAEQEARIKRAEFILNYLQLSGKKTLDGLFHSLAIKGYSHGRKTYQRDMQRLVSNNHIEVQDRIIVLKRKL